MAVIKVYGADWCPLTARALQHLRELGVEYEYIDIEADAGASKWVKSQNGGKEKKPTVDIAGRILSEPSNEDLDRALANAGIAR